MANLPRSLRLHAKAAEAPRSGKGAGTVEVGEGGVGLKYTSTVSPPPASWKDPIRAGRVMGGGVMLLAAKPPVKILVEEIGSPLA